MSQSAIADALLSHDPEEIRAAIYAELTPCIPAATDPMTYDPREKGSLGGNIWPAVIWQGQIWFRDPDDGDTDQDGITCIVTIDGSRYKKDLTAVPDAVLSRTLDTPPDISDSPAPRYGDSYIVPHAGIGEWSTHEDEIACWTARGWRYVTAQAGAIVLVEDEGTSGLFIHVDAAGEWADGTPGGVLPASIEPQHLLIREWSIENDTTTSPPATGPAGEQYIIGASATGAWAGKDRQLAYRPSADADFIVLPPLVGERAFDKALNVNLQWSGTAWQSVSGVWVNRASVITADTSSISLVSTGAFYAWATGTMPTTANQGRRDNEILTYAAASGDAVLCFRYECDFALASTRSAAAAGDPVIALFRDNESSAIAKCRAPGIAAELFAANIFGAGGPDGQLNSQNGHLAVEFEISAHDGHAHDYKIALLSFASTTGNALDFTPSNRRFSVQEAA